MYNKLKSLAIFHKFKILLIFQLFIKLLAVFLGIFTNRWLNTYLPEADYTDYNFITSLNATILGLLGLGIPILLQREYTNFGHSFDIKNKKLLEADEKAKHHLKKAWANYSLIRLLTFFVGFLIVLIAGYLNDLNLYYLSLIYLAQFILLWDQNYRSITDAMGRSWMFSITDLLSKLVIVGLLYVSIFSGIFQNQSLLSIFGWILCFGYLLGFCIDTFLQRKYISYNLDFFDFGYIKSQMLKIWPMILSGVILSMYFTTDRLILPSFVSDNLYNGYVNVYRLFEIATIVPGLISPILSSKIKKEMDQAMLEKGFGNDFENKNKYTNTKIKSGSEIDSVDQSENQDQAKSLSEEFVGRNQSQDFSQKNNSYKLKIFDPIKKLGLSKIVRKYALVIGLIGFLSCVSFGLFAPIALFLIDVEGRYMTDTWPSIVALSPSLIFMLFSSTIGSLTIFFGKEKYELYSHIINFFVAITSYFVFIRFFGIVGAAIGTTLFFGIDLCSKLYFFRKTIKAKILDQ